MSTGRNVAHYAYLAYDKAWSQPRWLLVLEAVALLVGIAVGAVQVVGQIHGGCVMSERPLGTGRPAFRAGRRAFLGALNDLGDGWSCGWGLRAL